MVQWTILGMRKWHFGQGKVWISHLDRYKNPAYNHALLYFIGLVPAYLNM